jgi:fatty-acyl-CoA synthase
VVYSHRSIVLYSLMANQPDAFGIREQDTVMPLVPMFHANAWGWPYIAAMAGARQVFPGPSPTPAVIADLIREEGVTLSAAVPTVWQGLADLDPLPDLSSVRELICGGSAVPEQLIRTYDQRFGVAIVQGWGMTETSPLGAISRLPVDPPPTDDERYALRAKQGRVLPFVSARLDQTAGGELQVRGPRVARGYFGGEGSASFTEDGWRRTGDVAELDSRSYIRLVDRTKDLVKSGGEWISSVELEAAALFHPGVVEAAVVARPDPKWGERPSMYVVARQGASPDAAQLRTFLAERFPAWWLPDSVEFVDELPTTSVGKSTRKSYGAALPAVRRQARRPRPPADASASCRKPSGELRARSSAWHPPRSRSSGRR